MMESSARSAAHTTMTRRGLIGAVLLAFLLSGGLAFGADEPDEDLPPIQIPTTGMKVGRLDAKQEKSVEISGRDYAFHPKIEFGDDEERRLEWKDFKRGDEVQYHLAKGQIDLLIRVLPK